MTARPVGLRLAGEGAEARLLGRRCRRRFRGLGDFGRLADQRGEAGQRRRAPVRASALFAPAHRGSRPDLMRGRSPAPVPRAVEEFPTETS